MLDINWRKASKSQATDCVEVRMLTNEWRKSSKSGTGMDCVEVRQSHDCYAPDIEVRNSKRPEAGSVMFTAGEWEAFIAGAKLGEFDLDG